MTWWGKKPKAEPAAREFFAAGYACSELHVTLGDDFVPPPPGCAPSAVCSTCGRELRRAVVKAREDYFWMPHRTLHSRWATEFVRWREEETT